MIDRAIDLAISYDLDLELLLDPNASQEELDAQRGKGALSQRWTFDPLDGIITDYD